MINIVLHHFYMFMLKSFADEVFLENIRKVTVVLDLNLLYKYILIHDLLIVGFLLHIFFSEVNKMRVVLEGMHEPSTWMLMFTYLTSTIPVHIILISHRNSGDLPSSRLKPTSDISPTLEDYYYHIFF